VPGHALHLRIARNCWETASARRAQLPELTPAVSNALYQGALGPDMGYFPRSVPLVTDAAHYVRTAHLVRSLFARASSDVEYAFAAGWLTHFLADTMIHPYVNEACGERLHGERGHFTSYEDSRTLHMQVELGLDAVHLVEDPEIARVRVVDVLDDRSIRFLVDAYVDTYGEVVTSAEMLRAHRAVGMWQGRLFSVMHLIGRRHLGNKPAVSDLPIATVYYPVRWASGLVARSSPAFGLTHTWRPADWLVQAIETVATTVVPVRFADVLGSVEDLEDLNLDTGSRLDTPYGPRDQTLRVLASRRGDPPPAR
jgi:hypothetical protein